MAIIFKFGKVFKVRRVREASFRFVTILRSLVDSIDG